MEAEESVGSLIRLSPWPDNTFSHEQIGSHRPIQLQNRLYSLIDQLALHIHRQTQLRQLLPTVYLNTPSGQEGNNQQLRMPNRLPEQPSLSNCDRQSLLRVYIRKTSGEHQGKQNAILNDY